MTQSAQMISRPARRARVETRNDAPLPPVHRGYATARSVLRNPEMHHVDAIDAAFKVLAFSCDDGDRALCSRVSDRLLAGQRQANAGPGAGLIVWIAISCLITCVAAIWISDAIAGAAFDAVNAPALIESN